MSRFTVTIEDVQNANLVLQGKKERPRRVNFLPSYKVPQFIYDREQVRIAFKNAWARIYG